MALRCVRCVALSESSCSPRAVAFSVLRYAGVTLGATLHFSGSINTLRCGGGGGGAVLQGLMGIPQNRPLLLGPSHVSVMSFVFLNFIMSWSE